MSESTSQHNDTMFEGEPEKTVDAVYRRYVDIGIAPTPLPLYGKHSDRSDYTNDYSGGLNAERADELFKGQHGNIGILLGEISGGQGSTFVVPEGDCPEAVALMPHLLPETAFRFGRESAPGSHHGYRVEGSLDLGKEHYDHRGKKVIELLQKGHVVAPSSVYPVDEAKGHPEHERSIWAEEPFPEAPTLSASRLTASAREWITGTLILRAMPPEGGRYEWFLALYGLMLRSGRLERDTVERIAFAQAKVAPFSSEEKRAEALRDIPNGIETTLKKLEEDGAVTGGGKLEEQTPGLVEQLFKVWGWKRPSRHCTDLGNAERLVDRHGQDLRHAHGLGWYVWNGQYWRPDYTGEVERRAANTARSIYKEAASAGDSDQRKELAKWATRSESAGALRAMAERARSVSGVPIEKEPDGTVLTDLDPMLFNVENGTLDLRTGELREHRREDLITRMAPVKYDPDADCETWKAFIERALPDPETRTFIQRALGYSLTGSTTEKCLFYLSGDTDTGKSTFVDTVQALFGKGYADTLPRDLLMAKKVTSHPTELADLKGKRFMGTNEVEEGRKLAESLTKQLTGGDRIKARLMREDFFSFIPTHKIWLGANHLPAIEETSDAIWNRIKLVPFNVRIPKSEQDTKLDEKLAAEASGILNWILQGCMDWQREDTLGESEEIRSAVTDYREEMDPLSDFFEQCCIFGPDEKEPKRELEPAYERWCEKRKKTPVAWMSVANRLKSMGCVQKRDNQGKVWHGVSLRPEFRLGNFTY